MINEVRIYYECLEQAKHFVLPIVKNVLPNTNTKLILLNKGNTDNYVYGGGIKKILQFKVPDILLTVVINEKEFPLMLLEFSEAVTTEDHELQRFDGYLGAVAGNCYYVKISPLKKSTSDHGGNVNYNTLEPYALIYERFNILSFYFKWPLKSRSLVKRNQKYLSCPPKINNFMNLIRISLDAINKKSDDLYLNENVLKITDPKILSLPQIDKWRQTLKNFKLYPIHKKLKSSRISWQVNQKNRQFILFKFNRMGHAMDPERGMIWYHRYRHNKPIISRIIFPSTGDVIFSKIKLTTKNDYLKAFVVGTGLNFKGLFYSYLKERGYLVNDKLISKEIDITDYIYINKQRLNKHLLSIFSNSIEFHIQDLNEKSRVVLFWKKPINPFKKISRFDSSKLIVRESFTEDDVNYIAAHQILKPNGFELVAVSYPGAQGDRAILPESGSGRKQVRKYVDIIAKLPKKYIELNESKGKFNRNDIKSDVNKLIKYKQNISYKNALYDLINKIDVNEEKLPIIISVAFWSTDSTNIKDVPLNILDFFMIISSDRKTWKIWRGGNLEIFEKLQGEILLDTTYQVTNNLSK